MIDTGKVAIVSADTLPPPTQADFIRGARPYTVGPGDSIAVDVFGLPDFSREVRVDSAGNISLPLVGSINVIGLNPADLARVIERKLAGNYVREPRVTVSVTETVSQTLTVDGGVRRPGTYPLVGPMTLMRAIARAEGASDYAKTNHVVVFRTVAGKQMAALYDLRAIRLGAYEDPPVYSNDVVVVGESSALRIFPQILQASGLLLSPIVALLNN